MDDLAVKLNLRNVIRLTQIMLSEIFENVLSF